MDLLEILARPSGEPLTPQNHKYQILFMQCRYCPLTYTSASRLALHVLQHLRLFRFSCRHCDFRCGQPEAYALHMRRHEQRTGTVKCTRCSYRTTCRALLGRHTALHHDKR